MVGILFKEGAANKALGPVFGSMPKSGAAPVELRSKLEVAELLPKDRGYYALAGSLTTPPCTEDVHWYVLKQPATASPERLAAFRKLYPMNARPVQPAHGRAISVSQ